MFFQVGEVERELATWNKELTFLYNQNIWLCFFRIPKLFRIHLMLVQQLEQAVIVNEIGFLLSNHSEEFSKMSSKVKVSDHALGLHIQHETMILNIDYVYCYMNHTIPFILHRKF